MTAPVYVAELENLGGGARVVLGGEEGHHAATVRRTRAGERIDLVDGAGTRARCEVLEARKGSLTLAVLELVHEPAPISPVTLVQALAKGGRDEQAVETATEYGASEFIPWQSERTIVSWRSKEARGRARWQATARAAAKQSRRSWIPAVCEVRSTKQLVAHLAAAAAQGERIYVCHEEGELTLAGELHASSRGRTEAPVGKEAGRIYVVVGPEGGITPQELDAFRGLGARVVLLAPHVLRSATAGPYALATLAALA